MKKAIVKKAGAVVCALALAAGMSVPVAFAADGSTTITTVKQGTEATSTATTNVTVPIITTHDQENLVQFVDVPSTWTIGKTDVSILGTSVTTSITFGIEDIIFGVEDKNNAEFVSGDEVIGMMLSPKIEAATTATDNKGNKWKLNLLAAGNDYAAPNKEKWTVSEHGDYIYSSELDREYYGPMESSSVPSAFSVVVPINWTITWGTFE